MKNKPTILIVALTCFISIQKISYSQKNYYEGNMHFEQEDYAKAIPFYKKLISVDSSTDILEKLAFCYQKLEQFPEAAHYYDISTRNDDFNPNSLLFYAESLHKNGLYNEAIKQYQRLLSTNRNLKHFLEFKIKSCKQASLWKESSLPVYIENVKSINSKYQETGLFLDNDGLYFSSSRFIEYVHDEVNNKKIAVNHFRIYKAKFSNIGSSYNLKDPNLFNVYKWKKDIDIAHPTFNTSEDIFYFSYSNSYQFGKNKFHENAGDSYTEMRIYQSNKSNRKWNTPKNSNTNSSYDYVMIHPCLSKDGKRLYFSSNMSSGKGKYDLYYCYLKQGGELSMPINLGDIINTSGMELYPSYADDSVLYFASDGHVGMGDLDIFKAKLENGNVVSVENLKHPINSSRNDFSIVFKNDFKSGYFCSDRPGGLGEEDIYYFSLNKIRD